MIALRNLLICIICVAANPALPIEQDIPTTPGRDYDFSLFGYQTPSPEQQCKDSNGLCYPCGEKSADRFAEIALGRELTCHFLKVSKDAICYAAGEDIAWRLIRDGWALADQQRLKDFPELEVLYLEAEESAKVDKVGLWRGDFVNPSDWRNGTRLEGCE